MSKILDDLRQDHRNIAKLLDILEDQVRVFEDGGVPDYDLLEHMVDYFLDYPDKIHHPKEDLVLKKLMARDTTAAEAVGDLMTAHSDLAEATRRFATSLEGLIQESQMPREIFPNTIREFVAGQRQHMNMEESRFLPAAEAALLPEDWEDVAREFESREDPLFGQNAVKHFEALRDYLLS